MMPNNKLANELIVDFPEHSHRDSIMSQQDRDRRSGDNNDDTSGRECRPHRSCLNRVLRYTVPSHHHHHHHHHGRPEISRSWNVTSTDRRRHSEHARSPDADASQASTSRSVQIARTSFIRFFTKHEDRGDVDCRDLWYSDSDIESMKLRARKDALAVRELAATGVPFDYFLGENDDNVVCLMGIEHCLTDARIKQTKASRKRCVRAVLQEQERQRLMGLSSILFSDWHRQDLIALTSFSQTGRAAKRARDLGLLHEA